MVATGGVGRRHCSTRVAFASGMEESSNDWHLLGGWANAAALGRKRGVAGLMNAEAGRVGLSRRAIG